MHHCIRKEIRECKNSNQTESYVLKRCSQTLYELAIRKELFVIFDSYKLLIGAYHVPLKETQVNIVQHRVDNEYTKEKNRRTQ